MDKQTAAMAILYARIPTGKIAFLKFILEGYDGLAVLTTVNRALGLVSLRYFPACRVELLGLLDSLQPMLIKRTVNLEITVGSNCKALYLR